jgi:hypothetical protein
MDGCLFQFHAVKQRILSFLPLPSEIDSNALNTT